MINEKKMISDILKQSKENAWPYPQTFQALKNAGVNAYHVSWIDQYEATYMGKFGEIKENAPQGFKSHAIAINFCDEAVKSAINEHQNGKSTYVELLEKLSNAGVCQYIVDMNKRTVTYFDAAKENSHLEHVPV